MDGFEVIAAAKVDRPDATRLRCLGIGEASEGEAGTRREELQLIGSVARGGAIQLQHIARSQGLVEAGRRIVAAAKHHEALGKGPQQIVAIAADQRIRAGAPGEGVIALAAIEAELHRAINGLPDDEIRARAEAEPFHAGQNIAGPFRGADDGPAPQGNIHRVGADADAFAGGGAVFGDIPTAAAHQRIRAGAAHQHVIALAATQRVGAGAALQPIRRGIAQHAVIAAAADRILDQGARVALELQRVEDVGAGHADGRIEIIGGIEDGDIGAEVVPAARGQVHHRSGCEGREIIGIGAAAIPDGQEDDPGIGGPLRRVVDEIGAGRRPAIDGIAPAGAEIRAVVVLQRRDVQHHQCLREMTTGHRVAAGHRGADVAPVGHHAEFHRIPVRRQGGEAVIGLMPMLQPHGMAGLVQDRVVLVGADNFHEGCGTEDGHGREAGDAEEHVPRHPIAVLDEAVVVAGRMRIGGRRIVGNLIRQVRQPETQLGIRVVVQVLGDLEGQDRIEMDDRLADAALHEAGHRHHALMRIIRVVIDQEVARVFVVGRLVRNGEAEERRGESRPMDAVEDAVDARIGVRRRVGDIAAVIDARHDPGPPRDRFIPAARR